MGDYGTSSAQTYSNGTDVSIPDNNSTGVTSSISVSGRSGTAPSATQVAVNIVHTYIGDLVVDLIAPDGSVYNLSNRSGGSADNINTTYSVNVSSEAINGTWKLRVKDLASGDTGYINSWSIKM
ncbi:MAG: proprotein convertase P-domain-containing protein [Thermomonas sp.]